MEFLISSSNKKRTLFAFITLVFLFSVIFSVKIPSVRYSPPLKLHRPPSRILLDETPSQSTELPPAISPESQLNPNPDTYLPHLRKSHSFEIESENLSENRIKKLFGSSRAAGRRGVYFPMRVNKHFSKCKIRFFMTWISSLNSFNERSFHSIESIFKTHPNGCVLIVSNSLDSIKGRQILKPFIENGFRVTAVSPDFDFLFKNTMAQTWFAKLIRTRRAHHHGDIPLGQNLSNLLRLCLLYKYGGVYIDFDIIILKSFSNLKNSIGAQTMESNLKNWTRLNNAVMVFDKMHPLLYKFIEEFALTSDNDGSNKQGAPYLVSRVVSRLQGRPGYNFTVLPPMAFYPVNWDKVWIIFRGAKNRTDSRWLKVKFEQIRNQSYSLHLWNKQSKALRIEDGSIVRKILSQHCVFCNTTTIVRSNTTSKEYVGREVIEARYLYGTDYDNIDIAIRPQFIIHFMVETQDLGVIEQLGWSDMAFSDFVYIIVAR